MEQPNCGAKAVFLDRDGVLNDAVYRDGVSYPPENTEAMRISDEAILAAALLKTAGYLRICVTNQPDIARGTRTPENVQAMNNKVATTLGLDDLFMCPHDNADACGCRKPAPGMLFAAMKKWGIDSARSWMVGDRWSDVAAGRAAGCRTILVGSPDGAQAEKGKPDYVAGDVLAAARIITASAE